MAYDIYAYHHSFSCTPSLYIIDYVVRVRISYLIKKICKNYKIITKFVNILYNYVYVIARIRDDMILDIVKICFLNIRENFYDTPKGSL